MLVGLKYENNSYYCFKFLISINILITILLYYFTDLTKEFCDSYLYIFFLLMIHNHVILSNKICSQVKDLYIKYKYLIEQFFIFEYIKYIL